MSKTKTPSFILELPLKKGDKDESVLLTRFEAARQLYNACLGDPVTKSYLVSIWSN